MSLLRTLSAASLVVALAPASFAQLSSYSEDFEALDQMDPAALTNAGFLVFANVFDPMGGYLYGYGAPAPNGGPGFSAIGNTLAGASQGTQYIDVYSDYNNGDHANGNFIDALVFREQGVSAANVGQTWSMTFDYRRNPVVNNGQGSATMFAFVKVLQSSNGSFATLAEVEFETTSVSTTDWNTTTIDFVIDPSHAGELLQFGFRSYATDYDDTSVLYDNISFGQTAGPITQLQPYWQDFEALDPMDPAALGNDGFVGFATVRDPMGNFLYNYGTFPAPNGGPGFSAIAGGQGGPSQGSQYINIYSDYNNGDHANGNLIEALVFQESPVGAPNVGETWRFSFDALRNPAVNNGQGNATMFAFVKVLQSSNNSFATLVEKEIDFTNASDQFWASFAIDLLIDPAYAGELLQFGFRSVATNYEDTGRFYDNLSFDVLQNPGLGETICLGNPQSTGSGSVLTITGSDVVANNNLTLTVDGLPQNAMGYFIHSTDTIFVYLAGGSEGHICIGSTSIGRFASNVLMSGSLGSVSFSPDLTALPTPAGFVAAMAGETRNFQYWTRDASMGMATSNFSSAQSVTFQ